MISPSKTQVPNESVNVVLALQNVDREHQEILARIFRNLLNGSEGGTMATGATLRLALILLYKQIVNMKNLKCVVEECALCFLSPTTRWTKNNRYSY